MLKDTVLGHIALAERHLKEADARIGQQRALVDGLQGKEKAQGQTVLATFLDIREQMMIHRRQLDEQLLLSHGPVGPRDG